MRVSDATALAATAEDATAAVRDARVAPGAFRPRRSSPTFTASPVADGGGPPVVPGSGDRSCSMVVT